MNGPLSLEEWSCLLDWCTGEGTPQGGGGGDPSVLDANYPPN